MYRLLTKLMHCMHFCKILRKREHEGVLHMPLKSYKGKKVLLWTENIILFPDIYLMLWVILNVQIYFK